MVDVTDFAAVERFVDAADAAATRAGRPVNSAGVFDGYAGIEETSPELWRRIIDVNLTGCFHGCKAASAVMARRRQGPDRQHRLGGRAARRRRRLVLRRVQGRDRGNDAAAGPRPRAAAA